jgi:hypothetical protein
MAASGGANLEYPLIATPEGPVSPAGDPSSKPCWTVKSDTGVKARHTAPPYRWQCSRPRRASSAKRYWSPR